ncbi:uncharacterized protein LOC113226762 isoform X2 [Hyposmocoma kahamanoa]|uniref:uncharacterized protein LOC113226762 isoform X2 n=1 Tax=Hyposmocoma kahamanoa TaxID=1477025 RepID=UPI000E6D8D40|nr:uncharacterized protein LOC113226762 isoform X2 [Hyposmocoma kahamanoa]
MFYPVESLKRGGRFYLCWVADSWPLRFAATTHKQLWSQDIRKLCNDLLEVMTNESGRPAHRFSLRLSSQLMRGLVRLYERKATILLSEMCMINAHVFKHANKKLSAHKTVPRTTPALPLVSAPLVPEELENEQRVEEMIQNSGNAVTNIQDITLKEAAIPEFQLPPNDGFGEETSEQVLQRDASAVQHSGLEQLDATEKSHDKTRLAPHDGPQMERLSEHDVTVFTKSVAEEVVPEGEIEKEIADIPEIPLPVMPAPSIEIQEALPPQPEEVQASQAAPVSLEQVINQPDQRDTKHIELEELEDDQQQVRRRRKPKLIIDKRTQIGSAFLRSRIDNITVELRCEKFNDDIADVRVPWDIYSRRPATNGARLQTRHADALTRMFQRNLSVIHRQFAEEIAADEPRQRRTRSMLEKTIQIPAEEIISEVPKNVNPSQQVLNVTEGDINITTGGLNITEVPNVLEVPCIQEPMDIADLPTQKLETISQTRKRTADYELSPKRQKSGYISSRDNQRASRSCVDATDKENIPPPHTDNENVPPEENIQELPQTVARNTMMNVSTMLQEAGLADMQPVRAETGMELPTQKDVQGTTQARKDDSESSETPQGSLDRTKVSLGDSVMTTDSQRFIRNQWGIEGTMLKILNHIMAQRGPVTVESLVARGPVMLGYKRIIAARCFTSILKLMQHGFINVTKDPETLALQDITLGPKFEGN